MEKLCLIGTVHLDPQGHERLSAMLGKLKPECVTVDVSNYALEYRRTIGRDLRKCLDPFLRPDGTLPPALQAVAAQLEIPYEYLAADDYAEKTGARLVAAGNSMTSQRLLGLLTRELMATDNLVALATRDEPPLADLVEREWKRARNRLDSPSLTSEASGHLARQNAGLARQIREVARHQPTVHVGGWEHLPGLGDLLADLGPETMLLRP